MAGTAHQVYGLVRWPGKPTSGRFVYRTRGGWYWQCDLHSEDPPLEDQSGPVVPTMQDAFAGALAHAKVCQPNYDDPEPQKHGAPADD